MDLKVATDLEISNEMERRFRLDTRRVFFFLTTRQSDDADIVSSCGGNQGELMAGIEFMVKRVLGVLGPCEKIDRRHEN